jgi:hypothetical protein
MIRGFAGYTEKQMGDAKTLAAPEGREGRGKKDAGSLKNRRRKKEAWEGRARACQLAVDKRQPPC